MITDHKSPHFARDVTRRNHRGKRALAFNSLKSEGGDIRVESALEKNVGLLLEADPRVKSYTAQPFTLVCCFRNNFSASLATLSLSFSTRGNASERPRDCP